MRRNTVSLAGPISPLAIERYVVTHPSTSYSGAPYCDRFCQASSSVSFSKGMVRPVTFDNCAAHSVSVNASRPFTS